MAIAEHFRFTPAQLERIAEKAPALAGQIAAGLEVERINDEKQRCENSLIDFLIAAWPHMGEAGELVINWHHEVIAGNLRSAALPPYSTPWKFFTADTIVHYAREVRTWGRRKPIAGPAALMAGRCDQVAVMQ
jgi:hypothetical protein